MNKLLFCLLALFFTKISAQSPYRLEMLKMEDGMEQVLMPGSAVTEGSDRVKLRLIKQSEISSTYYFTIIDIQPDGQLGQISAASKWEDKITPNSPDTINLPLVVVFTPPYGKESMLLLLTEQPLSLASNSRGSGLSAVLTTQDVKWIQQGLPPENIENNFFAYQFDFEIRPKSSVKSIPIKGGNKNNSDLDEMLDQSQYRLKAEQRKQAEIERIWQEKRAEKSGEITEIREIKVVNRFEVPNDEVYTVYPVLTFLEPAEPSYNNAETRGVKVTASPSKFESLVVKGTISCKQNVEKVEIWVQPDSGKAYKYEVKEFKQAPQSVIFESQVKIRPGKNLIEVLAITKDGHAVRQQLDIECKPEKVAVAGRNVLLCMAVNDYQHWNKLKNPVSDANALIEELTAHYGFDSSDVIKLYNQDFTKKKVDSVFRYLIQNLGENDKILVFYAGHGYYDELMQEGYWIPANGPALGDDYTAYISNAVIDKYIKYLKTKHTLFITDACFSGSYFVEDKRGADLYTTQMDKYRSRWLFTSGRMEVVADDYQKSGHSPFAYFLLNYLKNPASETFTISELSAQVTKSVSNNGEQLPMARSIKNSGDEGGEFVFKRR